MPKDNSWEITIDRFDGIVPAFWKNTNPSFGNRGHASDLQNVDLIDPSVLTQGPGLANLTNGTQAAAVTTLLRSIAQVSIDGTNTYGVGGNLFHQITASAVTNAGGTFPHTINKAVVTGEDAEDVVYCGGKWFYSYNHSGNAGDIGRYDGVTTFDDDYISTVPSGAAVLIGGVPHPMIVGGDNVLYVGNGRYIASFDPAAGVFVSQALDFPSDEVVVSLRWENNRVYATTVRPYSAAPTSQGSSSIYSWDATSTSWEYQIRIPGIGGGLFAKNGVLYAFYRQFGDTGGYHLAFVDGARISDLATFTGSLPSHYQITDYQNHILWLSSGLVWAWGAPAFNLTAKLFQLADGGYATVGALASPFGTPMVASTDGGSNFRLAKFSGYDVAGYWKSILFDLSAARNSGVVEKVVILTEPLSTGARMDVTITSDYGGATDSNPTSVAYDSADTSKVRWVIERGGAPIQNFRVNLDWSNGSDTNPVKVRKILIQGFFRDDF